jgi:hypothetical protein
MLAPKFLQEFRVKPHTAIGKIEYVVACVG